MTNEKDTYTNKEKAYDAGELSAIGRDRAEQISQSHEISIPSAEKARELLEKARHDAHEQAPDSKRELEQQVVDKRQASPAERRQKPTKKALRASYKTTMSEARTQMPLPSRSFSAFIHNPAVEKTSELVGSTIARPNAILSGSVFAFVFTLTVYLVARYYGYPLSGFETIGSFLLGWVVGIVYDFLKIMITGRR